MYSYKVCSLTEVTNFTGLLSFCSSCLVTACSIGLVCEHAVSFDQLFGDCNCKVTGSSTTSPLHSIVFKCSVIECYNIQKVDLKKKSRRKRWITENSRSAEYYSWYSLCFHAVDSSKINLHFQQEKAAIIHKQCYQEQRECEYIL